jgi:hypothetical protein
MSKQEATNSGGKKTTTPDRPRVEGKGEEKGNSDQKDSPPRDEDDKILNARSSKTTPKMWADPLNPTVPPNWEFLLSRGYVTKLTLEFTSYGCQTMVHVPIGPVDPLTGLAPVGIRSARDALQYFKDMGVLDRTGRVPDNVKKGKGVTTVQSGGPQAPPSKQVRVAPKASLFEEDFEGGIDHLRARVADVKANMTFTTVKGRILSIFKPDREATPTVEKWWAQATPSERLRCLCDEKRCAVIRGRKDLAQLVEDYMPQIGSPFLGSIHPKKGEAQAGSSRLPPPQGGFGSQEAQA